VATPVKTEMSCIVLLSDFNKTIQSGRLRLSFSDTGDFTTAETIYVNTDALAYGLLT